MIGRSIQGFEIRERLGAGGMGVVYAAWDTELKRMVALKVLPETARGDPHLWQRLRREAEAAASLTHPSICQIHRLLADVDPPALVLELVSGPTLAERIAGGPMPIFEAVGLIRRIAEGLAAAHARNVVHRDIKPSNILLAEGDRPKLTDFGLAVLPEATRLTLVPSPMGTVPYMSPEQVRGDDPTPQMDVWSLGVVMYELLTGERPFKGGVPEVIFHEIRHATAPSVRELRPDTPDAVAAIVERALERNPAARYASGAEMADDLRTVEQSMISASIPDSLLPHSRRPPHWRRRRALRLAVPVVLASALALASVLWLGPGRGDALPELEVIHLTENPWWEGEPSISPDGQRVAYAAARDGNLDIYVCVADGGRPFRLTEDPADDSSPTWTPDGTEILFASTCLENPAIWRVGQYGGDPTLLLDNATQPAVSPDGEWLAWVTLNEDGVARIAAAPLGDLGAARMITGGTDGVADHSSPAWSPDNRQICYSAYDGLWLVDRTGVGATRIASRSDFHADPVWSPDGKHVYFASNERQAARISRVTIGSGRIDRITLGTGPERHPTISASGTRMVYSTQRNDRDLVIRDLRTGTESRIASVASDLMPTVSPDGSTLLFVSDRWGGVSDLWSQHLEDGRPEGEPRLVLDAPVRCSMPEFSPDGHRIVFYLIDGDTRHLAMVDAKGGRVVELTSGEVNDAQPHWSPDGRRIVFVREVGDDQGLWQLEVGEHGALGEPTPIDTGDVKFFLPRWSPSGRFIAGVAGVEDEFDIWMVEPGSEPRRVTRGQTTFRLRWGADDSELWAVGYWGATQPELRVVDVATGETRPLDSPILFDSTNEDPSFEVSPSTSILVYTDAVSSGDLWMLQATEGTF